MIDDYRLREPEPKKWKDCEFCSSEIWVGEEYIGTIHGAVHEECYPDFANHIMERSYLYAGEDD